MEDAWSQAEMRLSTASFLYISINVAVLIGRS